MTRVELAQDLEARVARMLQSKVQRIAEEVAAEAREGAPDAHEWVSRGGAGARPSHAALAGVRIPGNLRFAMPAMVYQRGSGGAGGWRIVPGRYDLAREPRDRALPVHQEIRCQCSLVVVPKGVGSGVGVGSAVVSGARVIASVTVSFPRVAESEFPGEGDGGGGWLREAGREVVARYR